MTNYFIDKFNIDNEWQYTHIHIKDNMMPFYRLYIDGRNSRFVFKSPEQILYWSEIDDYYQGVRFLSYQENLNYPIIMPITSADIENFKYRDTSIGYHQYWANFFARQLLVGEFGILHQGDWFLQADGKIQLISEDCFEDDCFCVYQTDGVFVDRLHYIDWGINGSWELYALQAKPNKDSARVKWWRKKVRENSCPPILVWFMSNLNTYVIIDGHSRLLAYQLENIPAQFVVLSSRHYRQSYLTKEQKIANIKSAYQIIRQQLDGIERNLKSNNPIIRQKAQDFLDSGQIMQIINHRLIYAYHHDGSWRAINHAKPFTDFDKLWQSELLKWRKDSCINQDELNKLFL